MKAATHGTESPSVRLVSELILTFAVKEVREQKLLKKWIHNTLLQAECVPPPNLYVEILPPPCKLMVFGGGVFGVIRPRVG